MLAVLDLAAGAFLAVLDFAVLVRFVAGAFFAALDLATRVFAAGAFFDVPEDLAAAGFALALGLVDRLVVLARALAEVFFDDAVARERDEVEAVRDRSMVWLRG